MLDNNNCIQEIIGIKGLEIKKVINVLGEIHIYFRLKQEEMICPRCGSKVNHVHDYREQQLKDEEITGQKTILHYNKRRYRCPECGKRFAEENEIAGRYQRITRRLMKRIIKGFSKLQSVKATAKENNISETTAMRILNRIKLTGPIELPECLSIDEFKGNAEGEKFQCILADPKKKEVIDILPERKNESLYGYFSRFSNRRDVKYIVMDMSGPFREMAKTCFPKAKIVADRYHVVRQVCWAMENVRKTVQKEFTSDRRKYFKRSRFLLLKHMDKLKKEEFDRLEIMLSSSEKLRRAYYLLQEFYRIMGLKTDRQGIKRELAKWIVTAESYDLPEYRSSITAIRNWIEEILNSFEYGLTNGYTEGMNNKIKVLKRVSFGIRNFNRFRTRILLAAG